MLTQFEDFFHHHLSTNGIFEDHMSHPTSKRITTIALIGLILVLIYKTVFQIGIWLEVWELPGKEYFVDTPVHCAHVYLEVNAIDGEKKEGQETILSKPLVYHVEFSPEEYNEETPDLGTTVGFLRKKTYFLFKDSSVYQELQPEKFTFKSVHMFDVRGKELLEDDSPLCVQGVETGQTIKVLCSL